MANLCVQTHGIFDVMLYCSLLPFLKEVHSDVVVK